MTIDQTPIYHLCLSLIALGLVLWSSHDLFQSATGPNPSITALVGKGVFLLFFMKLLSVCVRKFKFYRQARALGCGAVPVYPHKDPILGLDLFLQALPHLKSHTISQWMSERLRTYGHTHFHRILGEWIILTDEPLNIKGALATNFNDWPIGGPRLAATLPILGANSVFTSNGQAWHINRAMIRPAFDRNLVSDMECFSRHTWNMVQRIPKDGSTFDMQRLLQDMTMDSATDFLLSHSTGMLTDKPVPGAEAFIKAFQEASDECATKARISPILLKLPNKKLDANITTIRDFVRFYLRKSVAEHKQRQERGERRRGYVFLDVLLAKDLSEEYLTDQVLSVLIAGRDTTAMAITVCFWYLAHNPRVVEKLRREILSVQEPTWWALRDMKYLNRVIKESLRLIPPVPTNARTANKDTVLPRGGGPDGKQPILVQKGQSVRWDLMSMHRRTDIYGPDADEFRPERWETFKYQTGWDYLPFHGGQRICIGQQFALTQIAYVLFRVLQRFQAIEARDDGKLRLLYGLTVSFAHGCPVSMTPA